MSVINDALQRAKTVQQNHPSVTANLPLRPIDPAQQLARGPGPVLPAALAAVVIAGIVSWWLVVRGSHAARTSKPVPTLAAKAPPAPVVLSGPSPDPSTAPAPAASAPAAWPTTNYEAAPLNPAVAVEPSVASGSSRAPGGAPLMAEETKPVPPKLQAVSFNPAQPSAIINGKTVYVGERFREFHVLAIDSDSATLVNGTQTNVLTME